MAIDNKIAELMEHAKELTSMDKEIAVDVSEDVAALVNGEELSEEFKAKAATIFEAAVVSRVKAGLADLESKFEEKLNENVETIEEGLIEKVDGYLNYVVESWITDNALALENGLKNEVFESFVSGMKNLFAEHYIEVPEERFDILDKLKTEVSETEAKLNEEFETNAKLNSELTALRRQIAVKELSEGLVVTDAEKFGTLSEELVYESDEAFRTKLQTIKENYLGKTKVKPVVSSIVTDSPVINETVTNSVMAKYLHAINSAK